jgi:serine/threonine protein kinase/DNA-binding beta-propeller fold protein YncE
VTEDTPGSGRFGVGSRIAGYRLDEEIGRGGMAVVYHAYDTRLERPVALKLLAPELARDDAFRQRFIRESRTAAAVDHPNIIPIFEAGEADGVLFIAMRFVHGRDLQSLVNSGGPLPVAQVCHIVSQVAGGLEAAHAHGLVHRDVKPGNILLDATASFPGHAYLSDFGLSKRALSDSALTSTGQFLGTVDYIAPEQIEGRAVDGRTDEYALACSVYTMLTGAPPFTRDESVAVMWAQVSAPPPPLTSRRPDLPPAVNDVMVKALAKVPAERYGTCPQFANALRAACGLEPRSGGIGPEPTQVASPGPERTQLSGWPPEPAGEPGEPPAAPPPHPATAVSGAPLASPPDEPGHPAPPTSLDQPAAASHPETSVSAARPGDAAGHPGPDHPDQAHQPSEDPDYAGMWRSPAAAGEPAEPPTQGVPPAQESGGAGWPGQPPPGGPRYPGGPGYPGPGRRSGRRRWPTAAGAAVGAAAVLAAGAFFLVGRNNGGGSEAAAAALKTPGCTTQVAKAAQLKHLSRHQISTGGHPFDVATVPGFAFVSIGSGIAVMNTSQPVPTLLSTTPMNHAQGEALTRDGQHLVVSSGDGIAVFRVSDLEHGPARPVGTLSSPGQKHAVEVALTPDGHYALVTYQNSAHVGVFNLQRALQQGFSPADLVGLIPVGATPIGVTVAPDGGLAYVTSGLPNGSASGNGVVNVISMAKAETRPAAAVTKTVSAGCKPSRVMLSADGQQLWVTAGGSNALLAFSVPKLLSDPGHALLARVPVGTVPLGMMFINHGSRIVVADSDKNNQPGASPNLAVVDVGKALARQPALLGYAQSGMAPRQFALGSDGTTLLVTNTSSAQLESLNVTRLP